MSKLLILAIILRIGLGQIEPDIDYYRNFEKLFDLPSVCNNISNEVSEGCQEQFMQICKNKTLLFSMYDANSKFPYTGLNAITRADMGNYDECLAIDHQYDKGRILGKYCYSGLLIPDIDPNNYLNYFKLSVCKPNNCSDNDYKIMFKHPLFIDGKCETKEDWPTLTTYDIITTCVFGVVLALMCLSTLYDLNLRKIDRKAYHPILLAFSVLSNWEKLTKVTDQSNKEQILVLNGLKVFSMMWVLYGHSTGAWLPFSYLVMNGGTIVETVQAWYEFYAFDGLYAVDTFFFISGFLMAWSYLKMKHVPVKTQILNIPMLYFYRYIRLTPAVAALIIFEMSVFKHMGSGPFWTTITDVYEVPCRQYWWSTILYIQNYYNYDGMCLMHTWYLSADMQMFVFAPLVVIPLAVALRNPKRLTHCMIALFLLNCVFTGVPIWMRMANRDTQNSYSAQDRLVDYCFGIMLATFMRETKDKPFLGKKLSEKTKWYLNLAIWCIILTGFTGLLIGTRQVELHSEYEGVWTFYMMKRFIWSIILSWIIYSSYHGYGGVVSYILSTPLMQFGAKLSFSMYLVHLLVLVQNISSSRTMFYIGDYFSISPLMNKNVFCLSLSMGEIISPLFARYPTENNYSSDRAFKVSMNNRKQLPQERLSKFLLFASMLVVTAICSIIWSLAFELPCLVLQSCLLRPVRSKKS